MKKSILFLFLFALLSSLVAQTNRLESYQVATFDGVTRISLTFTNRPISDVVKEANSLRLRIRVPNCDIAGGLATRFTTSDPLAQSIQLTRENRDLNIAITTITQFDKVNQSGSAGQRYTLHIDMIGSSPPRQLSDFTSQIDYQNYVGNSSEVRELLREGLQAYPQNYQLSLREQGRFSRPVVFSAPRTPVSSSTAPPPPPPSSSVAPIAITPPSSSIDIPIIPREQTSVQPSITPPPRASSFQGDRDEVSFTLITRTDRFPTRIPQTKPIFVPERLVIPPITPPAPPVVEEPPIEEKLPDPEPELPPPPAEQPPPVVEPTPVTPPPVVQAPVEPPPAVQPPVEQRPRPSILNFSNLSEVENLVLSYLNIVKIDTTRVDFMVGINANIAGDFQTSVDYLQKIPEYDVSYDEAIRWLYDSYHQLGDTLNADFYAKLIAENLTPPEEEKEIWEMPVALWIAGGAVGLALLIGFLIALPIGRGKKKDKKPAPAYSDEDLAVHKKNLERAYQNKDIKDADNIETTPNRIDTTIGDDAYDNPPTLVEPLYEEEEAELIKAEAVAETKNPPPDNSFKIEDPPSTPDDDLDMNSYSNDGKKLMVQKLTKDGWSVEEIAREVQISQREIEFIQKMG